MINAGNNFIFGIVQRIIYFLPNFFAGLLILFIGLVTASILKRILLSFFSFFKLPGLLQSLKLMGKSEVKVWEEVLAEVLRWSVIILFLIPTLEAWGLTRATPLLNQFLLYLPNVIVAVIIGFLGLIFANLMSDVVRHSFAADRTSARTAAIFTRGTIVFFTILVVLNQLGVAQDLIRILFTGIVAMIAIAGGLAFGLGGQTVARDLLQDFVKKMQKSK